MQKGRNKVIETLNTVQKALGKVIIFAVLAIEFLVILSFFVIGFPYGIVAVIATVVLDVMIAINFGRPNINLTVIGAAILIVLFGTAGVYSVIFIITRNPERFDGAFVGNSADWIAFSGSIIGGMMTMLAVIFTIQHEKLLRNQEKIDQLKPFIHIDFKMYENSHKYIFNDRDEFISLYLQINNISNNNLRDFRITQIVRKSNLAEGIDDLLILEKISDNYLSSSESTIGLIKANSLYTLYLKFAYLEKSKTISKLSRQVYLTITSEYYDVFGNGPYIHETNINLRHISGEIGGTSMEEFYIDKIINKAK